MLSLPSSVRVYAALGATDMRKSFDTLAEEVRRVIEEDPLSGALFVFCNRARNRIPGVVTRVALPDMPEGQWWTKASGGGKGRFELPAVPLGVRLTFEGASEIVAAGARDAVAVTMRE